MSGFGPGAPAPFVARPNDNIAVGALAWVDRSTQTTGNPCRAAYHSAGCASGTLVIADAFRSVPCHTASKCHNCSWVVWLTCVSFLRCTDHILLHCCPGLILGPAASRSHGCFARRSLQVNRCTSDLPSIQLAFMKRNQFLCDPATCGWALHLTLSLTVMLRNRGPWHMPWRRWRCISKGLPAPLTMHTHTTWQAALPHPKETAPCRRPERPRPG